MEIVEYTLTYDSVEEFKPTTGADTLCDHDRYTCKSLGNTPDFCALSGMAVDGNYDNDDPKFFKAGELSYNSCEVVLRDNGYWILQAYTAGDNDYVQCRARCLAF